MDKTTSISRFDASSNVKKAAIVAVMSVIFSFFGWLAETALFFWLYRGFRDRGLLTLPFCPLYGFGALAVYSVLRTPQSGIWHKLYSAPESKAGRFFAAVGCVILYTLAAAILASLVEYFTGWLFTDKFGVRLWSYERYPDNVNGYVSLRYSLLWGIMCVSSMGLIWHPVSNLLARADTAVIVTVAVLAVTVIAVDFSLNMIYLATHGERFTLNAPLPLPRILPARARAFFPAPPRYR